MKNDKYMSKAIAQFRETASDHQRGMVASWSDNDLETVVLSLYNRCQEIALEESEMVEINMTEEEMLGVMKLAHQRDVTFNEFVTDSLMEYITKEDLV